MIFAVLRVHYADCFMFLFYTAASGLQSIGLQINVDKTKVMVIGKMKTGKTILAVSK